MSPLHGIVPHIDPSFIEEINKRNEELYASIMPLNEVLAQQIKPIIDSNQEATRLLYENYDKVTELYKLKEQELDSSRVQAEELRGYNRKMFVIALISVVAVLISTGIALASLIVMIKTACP